MLLNHGLTATDLFCGAGGSGVGIEAGGAKLVIAANHWKLAVDSHQLNFPHADHDIADISQVDPRRYPATDILWASPECTNHSQAKGVSRKLQADALPSPLGPSLPNEAAERSRATMWDVPRFAEAMLMRGTPYKGIIVENVVEASQWVLYKSWMQAMSSLGYQAQEVYLNSAFASDYQTILGAPQSRDRMYVVFWRDGSRMPDLSFRPQAHCASCDVTAGAVQTWKKQDRRWGRYNSQYYYACVYCKQRVDPFSLPAAYAIDWSLPGQRIGDRERPLADATMRRIRAGLERYGDRPAMLIPAGGTWNDTATPIDQLMRTRTTKENEGLLTTGMPMIIPLDRGSDPDSKRARPVDEPFATMTARATNGILIPGNAFIAIMRGGGCKEKVDGIDEPLNTVTASGNHHMLVVPNGFMMRNNNSSSGSDGGEMCTPFDEPMRTLTSHGHQSVVSVPPHLTMAYSRTSAARPAEQPMATLRTHDSMSLIGQRPEADDCSFRMLEPHEIQAAMAFPNHYQILGTKRERVRQCGNAVTPPAAQMLVAALAESIVEAESVA